MTHEHRDLISATWRTSSYSGGGQNCVEIAPAPQTIGVRDTKNRAGGVLTVSPATWTAFLHTVQAR